MRLSTELRAAIKLASPQTKAYELAQAAGTHPSTLSGWITGAFPVRDGDPRVLKIAQLVGVAAHRAFDADPDYSNFEVRSVRR